MGQADTELNRLNPEPAWTAPNLARVNALIVWMGGYGLGQKYNPIKL